jgi:hypothetical protein
MPLAGQFLSCFLQTGYGGLSSTIRVHLVIKVGLTPFSALSATARAETSYLNTSAGLVRTVVQNELTVHGVW